MGWVTKESKTHPGAYYKYNTETGECSWVPQAGNTARGGYGNGGHRRPNPAPTGSGPPRSLTETALSGMALSKGSGRHPLTRTSKCRGTNVSWGTDDTVDGSECVCTICECGRHKCPLHGLKKSTPFGGDSRYKEDFPEHPLRPQHQTRAVPIAQPKPSDPDQFKTKYAEDFPGFVPDPPRSMRPAAEPPLPTPFDGTTTNREMLCPKPLAARPRRRPRTPVKPSKPFEGTTTNKDSHREFHQVGVRQSLAPHSEPLPTAPFQGTTQYAEDFVERPLSVKGRGVKAAEAYDYGPPREFHTENRTAFDHKELGHCPVLDLQPKDPSRHTGHVHYTKKDQSHQKNTNRNVRYWPAKSSSTGRDQGCTA